MSKKSINFVGFCSRLGAVWFNADAVRININKDLGFTLTDRIEQPHRMGWLCDRVVEAGVVGVADFVCPTGATRAAFGEAFTVWADRLAQSRYADTNALFEPPVRYDLRVSGDDNAEVWAHRICEMLMR